MADDNEENGAFSSFTVANSFSPCSTHHGHLQIGTGLHIGPSRCWSIPKDGVLDYLNYIAADVGSELPERYDPVLNTPPF